MKLRLQNETLLSQQAKIQEQNIDIHFKNQRLELLNERSKSNEEVLKKAYIKLKENDQRIKEQLHTIEVSNKTLSSSINAAQTIQNAILPQKDVLKTFIGDYLLIYKPKNIVSGDFYWFCQYQESTFLAVLDCTGHGVPGAFMTLIGSILLDKIINVQGVTSPAEVLAQLHQEVERVLRQKETGNINGIDIAILKISPQVDNTYVLTFSGAKRPLWYWDVQNLALSQIQGARRSIGGEQDESVAFVDHHIHLSLGSLVYLFSDGFADQNDFKRRKLGEERLYSFVAGIVGLPLTQQQALLEELLAIQMNNCEQRDDIIFLGFKLGL
ncbi:MAG TPA: hypothetical protein DCM08_04065 [Microscillaceae bacterium]|jgi:serine phosphatase RsbU (regulator of sigma subunit)|nr:hypothetical protein [Microscillaceae bacterium]